MWRGLKRFFHSVPSNRSPFRPWNQRRRRNNLWPSKHHKIDPPRLRYGAARKTRVGEVISDQMNKTIVVRTTTSVPHPKFGKIVKQIRRFYAHDEENKAKTGDTVRIMETRQLSKLKRWRLVEVLQK